MHTKLWCMSGSRPIMRTLSNYLIWNLDSYSIGENLVVPKTCDILFFVLKWVFLFWLFMLYNFVLLQYQLEFIYTLLKMAIYLSIYQSIYLHVSIYLSLNVSVIFYLCISYAPPSWILSFEILNFTFSD